MGVSTRIPVNNLVFADSFTNRMKSKGAQSEFLPESAMLLLKTYLSKDLNLDNLHKIFNKNQELIEIPLPVALYIGGLYYFSEPNITDDTNNILAPLPKKVMFEPFKNNYNKVEPQLSEPEKLYFNTNGVLVNGKEVYHTQGVQDEPTKSVSPVVNRGLYTPFNLSNLGYESFSLPNGSVLVSHSNVMPSVGYGIQNSYLNEYNKFLFGSYLDGHILKNPTNQNKPYVLAGGHLGILKPIKTSDNNLELTGYYRNVFVGSDFKIDSSVGTLTAEFNDIINQISKNKLQGLTKFFVFLGKIKTAYVANYINDVQLKQIMSSLVVLTTSANQITKHTDFKLMSDIYFLVRYVLFSSYRIPRIDNTIENRFVQPKVKLDEYLSQYLEPTMDSIFKGTLSEGEKLTNFFISLWDTEKSNFIEKYSSLNSKVTFALYPSAGGLITPENILEQNEQLKLQYIVNGAHHLDSPFSKIRVVSNTEGNVVQPQYISWADKRREDIFEAFDNNQILKNTSRLLWFDDVKDTLKLKRETLTNPYSGLESFSYAKNHNYFNTLNRDSFDIAGITEFYSQPQLVENNSFSRLLDFVDFHKLEYFKELFVDFSSNNLKFFEKNINAYNLKTLMLASTTVTYDDIAEVNHVTANLLTKDEIVYALIGNCMYNYDFVGASGIGVYLNTALTNAQIAKNLDVLNEFNGGRITINNFTPIGTLEVNVGTNKLYLNLHNFLTSPDLFFSSNYKNVTDLIAQYVKDGLTEDDVYLYFFRKLIFGDQFIEPYINPDADTISKIGLLNEKYLIHNKLLNGYDVTNGVVNIFKLLNVKVTTYHYKFLFKIIRSYLYNTLKENLVVAPKQTPSLIAADNTVLSPVIVTSSGWGAKVVPINTQYFKDIVEQTITNGYKGFASYLESISSYFESKTNPNSDNSYINQGDEKETEDDLKKNTYYNIKTLYDRFASFNPRVNTKLYNINTIDDLKKLDIESILKEGLFYNFRFTSEECYGDQEEPQMLYDLYQIFQIVDRGNNDIGTKVLADLGFIHQNYYDEFNKGDTEQLLNITRGSVVKIFSGLANNSGFIFQQIPNYLNLNSTLNNVVSDDEGVYEVVDHMFGTHTSTRLFGDTFFKKRNIKFGGLTGLPSYVFQLGTINSDVNQSKTILLGNDDSRVFNQKNRFTSSFCLDVGVDNNGEISTLNEDAPDELVKSNVTCFTVDFTSQNQQMFNNLQLNTTEFANTEESINTWVNLLNETQGGISTQNLFPILEKRSYTCLVTSLGNATIQPLSYFYLRNVPLFGGTYWITNVSHRISPNTMITNFNGVRQPIATKSDIRKQLLQLFKRQAATIRVQTGVLNQIVTTSIPNTADIIKKVITEDKTYSEVIQSIVGNEVNYYPFDGKELLGFYLYSITKADDSEANKGLLAYLYNNAKAFTNTEDHKTILNNMVNVAIADMRRHAEIYNDTRYSDGSNSISLSKLFKSSVFDKTGKIAELLNTLETDKSALTTLRVNKVAKVFNLQTANTNGGSMANTDHPVNLTSNQNITNVDLATIDLSKTTIYLDPKATYSSGKIYDLSNKVLSYRTTLYTMMNVFGFNATKLKDDKGTDLVLPYTSVNNIKFLGAYGSNQDQTEAAQNAPKIALFSTSYAGMFGKVEMNDTERKGIYLTDANESDIEAIVKTQANNNSLVIGWINPVKNISINSKFGDRNGEPHKGIDLQVEHCVTECYSVLPGRVVHSGTSTSYGNVMVIAHPTQNITTLYAHLCDQYPRLQTGTFVSAGTVIARAGGKSGEPGAGRSTGQHLHFEVRIGVATDYASFLNLTPTDPINYINGGNETVTFGEGADYWTLVAICATENYAGNLQGMADTAQSIYNRLGAKAYGNSIKEIVLSPGQYEPVFKNKADWQGITSKESAIKAIMKSKGLNNAQATKYIQEAAKAISNMEYRNKAKMFIGTRTEFLATKPTDKDAVGMISRSPTDKNNCYFWNYAGKNQYYNKNVAAIEPPSEILKYLV